MKDVYPVIFTWVKGEIMVEVPNMDIYTQGMNMSDAIDMARDAIGIKGISYEDDGMEIPHATDMSEIDIDKSVFKDEGERTVISLVDVDFAEYRRRNDNKMVRRNVTLPNWLNQAADKADINVSKVLQEALKERIEM